MSWDIPRIMVAARCGCGRQTRPGEMFDLSAVPRGQRKAAGLPDDDRICEACWVGLDRENVKRAPMLAALGAPADLVARHQAKAAAAARGRG